MAVFLWWCFCDLAVVVFLWWYCCGGVFVVVFLWWCFCGGVVVAVFLRWCCCGGVFVVVFLWCCCVVALRPTKYYTAHIATHETSSAMRRTTSGMDNTHTALCNHDMHAYYSSHMKRPVQCAEQPMGVLCHLKHNVTRTRMSSTMRGTIREVHNFRLATLFGNRAHDFSEIFAFMKSK